MAIRADEIDLSRDRDLVRRYQAGDAAAFDDLYRQYYPRLRSFCQRRVGDAHTAEEIAQESFIRAMRALPQFAGEQRFYPWMTVIAKRLCIDHHRRHARVEPNAVIDLGFVNPDLDHLDTAVDHGFVKEAVAQLAPRHREVLDLREGQGLSYQDIADQMDVPVTTVEALLHRARKALRREYLAVSGERRGLWGLPVFGWFARKGFALRTRIDQLGAPEWAALAAPVVAGVAAVAIAIVPNHAAANRVDSTLARPVAAITTQADPGAGSLGPLGRSDLPTGATTTTAAPADEAAEPLIDPGDHRDDVLIGDGSGNTDAMPDPVDAGPATVGANLPVAIADTGSFAQDTANNLTAPDATAQNTEDDQ